ncbi:DNA internalization-related competence protein ComEC/Rec2 [Pseudoalteromonas peptidolytica]|uniref:DNA internalization-related competence protein ComEC/Rec2 n=1 Tax=Pseudoalteromonas peptidolytica TaxID=61150 RepID=UPI001CE47FBE|nr:DNA internalization-related competence protein ComEC/Rec2 [Pseudoalteromonas peptidolytica]
MQLPSTWILICFGIILGSFCAVFFLDNWRVAATSLFLYFIGRYSKPFSLILAGFILGISVVLCHYVVFYKLHIPQQWLSGPIMIVGEVIEVSNTPSGGAVVIDMQKIASEDIDSWRSVRAKLYQNDSNIVFSIGDKVEVLGKLKRFRSRINIGLFNAELNAFRKHHYFKGNILRIQQIESRPDWRTLYRQHIASELQSTEYGWFYYILLTGDTSKATFDNKRQFRQLGLSHLLAISGLHIGIVFGLAFLSLKILFYCSPISISQHTNLHQICLIFAVLLCVGYVFVCGYSVSATRALVMASAWTACYLFTLRGSAVQILTTALFVVLIIDPFALLNPGLYYSFFAVAIILTLLPKSGSGVVGKLLVLVKLQVALFVFLLPLNLYFFAGVSVVSTFANLIIIPFISIIVVPVLILHFCVFDYVDWQLPLDLVDTVLTMALLGFKYLPVDWLALSSVSAELLICTYLSVLLFVIFRHYLSVLPLFFYLLSSFTKVQPNWQLDVFDVGHGTAVLISKNRKGLLYDLGAKYFGYFSIFEFVIKPYLSNNRIQLDATIVSHDDGDHNGGLDDLYAYDGGRSLLQFHNNEQLLGCNLGKHQFAGLDVQIIWPSELSGNDNNNSCVVRVSDGQFSVLLPGDIEKRIEAKLINEARESLKADILLVPHHGSASSSSEAFVEAVMPKFAVFSRAFHSPWKIPNEQVVNRYKKIGATLLDTALDGHIRILIFDQKIAIQRGRLVENYWFLR